MAPRTILASRWRSAVMTLGAVALVVACLWVLGRHNLTVKSMVAGWLGVPFFAVCGVFALIETLRPAELVIDDAGLRLTRWLGSPLEVAWRDIEPLFVWRYRATKMVAWRYAPGKERRSLTAKINAGMGVDGSLPGHFPISAHALAELMNGYRSRAVGRR